MQRNLLIYEGFADGLEALNQEIVSDSMGATPLGRAYKTENGLYFGPVHIFSIAEDDAAHFLREREFNEDPDRFGGRVYMGAAGFLNFGYIAASKPAAVILFDVNAAQTLFWKDAIKALAENENVEGFIQFLREEQKNLPRKLVKAFNDESCPFIQKLLVHETYRDASDLEEWIECGLKTLRPDSYWMKRGYQHLHMLAKHHAIGAITLDVIDDRACAQLKKYLDEVTYQPVFTSKAGKPLYHQIPHSGARVDMLYISNIFSFLSGKKDFTCRALEEATPAHARQNLSMLLKEKTPIIINDFPKPGLTWPKDP